MNQEEQLSGSWEHQEVMIQVNQYGSFKATVEGEDLYGESLTLVKEKITKKQALAAKIKSTPMSLKIIALMRESNDYSGKYTFRSDVQKGIHKTTGKPLYEAKAREEEYSHVLVDTPESRLVLQELLKAKWALQAAEDKARKFSFLGSSPRSITAENYEAMVQDIENRYNQKIREVQG